MAGGAAAEDLSRTVQTNRHNLFDTIEWNHKPLLTGDRRHDELFFSGGELSVGTDGAPHRRIILGGTPRPPLPTEPAYFEPIEELLGNQRESGTDPGQVGLDRLEAAFHEFKKADEAEGVAHQYHRALGDQIFVECQEGSVALPRVRGREETFVDATGQEWARERPAAEEASELSQAVRSSEGSAPPPAIADPKHAEQVSEALGGKPMQGANPSPIRGQIRSGKVGSGANDEPTAREGGQDPSPLSERREDNREVTETEELAKLRALTSELSENLGNIAALGERDPAELELLLRNTMKYLSARQAVLQRRRKHSAAGPTWAPLEPGINTSRFCEWTALTAARVDEAERVLLENAVTPETLRK